MNYLDHLEKYCGEFVGHFEYEDLAEENIQFLKFDAAPSETSYTVSTLGLLWHTLHFTTGNKVHQEIMMSLHQSGTEEDVLELLWQLTNHALSSGEAFDLGEYYSLPENVLSNYDFSAVYVTAPFYFDESFAVYEGNHEIEEPETVLPVWFVPIFSSEEKYIEKFGVEKFNTLLFNTNKELLDLKRKPLI